MPRRVGVTLPFVRSMRPACASISSSLSKPPGTAVPAAVRRPSISASARVLRASRSSPSAIGSGQAATYSRGRATFHHRRADDPSVAYERAPVESLHAEAEPVDTTLQPGLESRLVGAAGVGLQRDLGVGLDVEGGADVVEHNRDQLRRQQARRAAAEIYGPQLSKRTRFTSGGELGV